MKLECEGNKHSASVEMDTFGGRITSLRVDGMELILAQHEAEPAGITRWGLFPMAPWCGRLGRGRLTWTDKIHRFPLTHPPHAIHGLVHDIDWTVVDDTTMTVELPKPWPFGGRVTQRLELTPQYLTVHGEVTAGDVPMPAMLGWHPWFRRQLARGKKAALSILAESSYLTDETLLPTGALGPVPAQPWDTCLVDLLLDPVIDWPNALTVTISSSFDHWVVYTEPQNAFCVEPQSGPPNEPNIDPHILQPGESLTGSITIAWQ
ncbi:MAG: hypothetical protein R2770_06455 [Acidimicrobiales bacterium]|nr:hypothetical protein [Acidimicrobiales bacterium]